MANFVYTPYRNSVVGKTSDYSTRVDCDTDTLFALFNDDGAVPPLATHVFQSSYTAAENPSFANRETLASVTAGVVGTAGVVDMDDPVYDGSQLLTGSTSVESWIVSKFITNAAASPVLVRFDTATGIPFNPNGAAVTVAINSGGLWNF